MTEYEKGDKVVVEIDEADASKLNNERDMEPDYEQILGKLEDFQPAEPKIRFTAEEKKEFDKLKFTRTTTLWSALLSISDGAKTPKLQKKLFLQRNEENNKAQLEFACVWDKPSRIEVIEPERHAVNINGARLYKFGNEWSFDKGLFVRLTLDEVKEAEKQLGIQGLQDKWHEAAKENKK